jgi:hypothetical protein
MHDGSLGFILQSTGGVVPAVQLLMHEGPAPFPPDATIVMLALHPKGESCYWRYAF